MSYFKKLAVVVALLLVGSVGWSADPYTMKMARAAAKIPGDAAFVFAVATGMLEWSDYAMYRDSEDMQAAIRVYYLVGFMTGGAVAAAIYKQDDELFSKNLGIIIKDGLEDERFKIVKELYENNH